MAIEQAVITQAIAQAAIEATPAALQQVMAARKKVITGWCETQDRQAL